VQYFKLSFEGEKNMSYNETALMEAETISELLVYANQVSGDVLFSLLVISIFFIGVMSLRNYGFDNALMTSGFFCFIVASLMASVGWVSVYLALVFGILTAGMFFYSVVQGS
jgi:hypothetical protein